MSEKTQVADSADDQSDAIDSANQGRYEPTGSSNSFVIRFGIFMLCGLVFLAWIGRTPPSIAVGEPLPPLDLQPLINGEPISNESIRDKVVVLHFWGTWCSFCRKEFPAFAQMVKRYENDESIQIVSITCSPGPEMDTESLQRETSDFLKERDLEMPTYCDKAAMTRQQIGFLLNGSFGYPTTIVVGPDGVIVEAIQGAGQLEKLSGRLPTFLQ